jgi:hypothetical protein
MASNYVRGRSKEYACIETLEQLGYTCLRAASSKGLFDVVGVRFDGTALVQVKLTSSGDFSEDENCSLLRDLPVHPSTLKELWLYEKGKGLVEVRDLKALKSDARTKEGKALREESRQRATEIKKSSRRLKNAAA